MISVLILTHNEAQNLPRCLEALKWSDDVVVLDSFSTDDTVEIAKAAGARVIQRKFDNERNQRTYSIQDIAFKYPWVYNPDADEVTPSELRDEMLATVADPKRHAVAYRLRFKTMFMGKWLRFSSLYPTWVVRLFRPNSLTFERSINLIYKVNGPVGELQSHFLHYTFNNGLDAWFAKHNYYSHHEAVETLQSLDRGLHCWPDLLNFKEPSKRRRALKGTFVSATFSPDTSLYIYVPHSGRDS